MAEAVLRSIVQCKRCLVFQSNQVKYFQFADAIRICSLLIVPPHPLSPAFVVIVYPCGGRKKAHRLLPLHMRMNKKCLGKCR